MNDFQLDLFRFKLSNNSNGSEYKTERRLAFLKRCWNWLRSNSASDTSTDGHEGSEGAATLDHRFSNTVDQFTTSDSVSEKRKMIFMEKFVEAANR